MKGALEALLVGDLTESPEVLSHVPPQLINAYR
jgi:hypothetical protein